MGLFIKNYREDTKAELERATRKIEAEAKKKEMAKKDFQEMTTTLNNNITFAELLDLITEDEAYRFMTRNREAGYEYERRENEHLEMAVDENHMTMVEANRRITDERQKQIRQQDMRREADKVRQEDAERSHK